MLSSKTELRNDYNDMYETLEVNTYHFGALQMCKKGGNCAQTKVGHGYARDSQGDHTLTWCHGYDRPCIGKGHVGHARDQVP